MTAEPEHMVELACGPAEAIEAARQMAADWGARWETQGSGATLELPVVAGLRRGWVAGPVTAETSATGSRLRFRVERSVFVVQRAAVVVLLISALAASATMLWPFFPKLLALAPTGAVLAVAAWLLVVSRLRSSGPEDFLSAVAKAVSEGPTGPQPSR